MTGAATLPQPVRATRPLSVELAGLPGAGKSRLARSLAEGLAARGLSVTGPDRSMAPSVGVASRLTRKATASAGVAARHPVLTARVAGAVARTGQPGLPDVAGRLVQWQVAQALLAGAHPASDVRVLDEGPVQALWSVGLRGDVTPALHALDASAGWRSADLLVVVRIDLAAAAARLTRRRSRHSRLQDLDPAELLGELRRGAVLLDRLVQWWGSRCPGGVVEVDGTQTGPEHHLGLLDRVASASRQRPGAGHG